MLITGRFVYNNFDRITESIRTQVSKAVRKAAFDVQGQAQANVPVDTGAAKASIYVATSDTDGYAKAVDDATSFAQARNVNAKAPKFFDDVMDTETLTDMQALVVVAVNYGYWLEYGTSKRPARPFLIPAMLAIGPIFDQAIAQAVAKGAQNAGGP